MAEKNIFCVEITGEGLYHNCLNHAGFSGKIFRFFVNRKTDSYVRAYRTLEDYLADRDDMHVLNGVWALKFNEYPADQIDALCFTTPPPAPEKPKMAPESATVMDAEPASAGDEEQPEPPVHRGPGRPRTKTP